MMQTKKELQEELDKINLQIRDINNTLNDCRERGLKIAGKIELLQDQEKENK